MKNIPKKRMMDEKGLRSFIASADNLSFSVAADSLFITQSALSKRIAALEDELGAKLFERTHNQLTLTEFGQRILPYAMSMVNSLVNGREALSQAKLDMRKQLKIGIVNFFALNTLPDFLDMFRQMHPDISISLWYVHQSLSYTRLINHEIDLSITSFGRQRQTGFRTFRLWKQEYNIVVSKQHPLAKLKKTSLKTISQYPVITHPAIYPTRKLIEEHMVKCGFSLQIQNIVDTLPSLIELIKQGYGWGLVPSSIVDPNLVRLYRHEDLYLESCILYSDDLKMTDAITTFIEEIKSACSINEFEDEEWMKKN